MKKGLLFILLAAAPVCLPAQEKENAAKSYRVGTNRFSASWFTSGGAGTQMYFGDNDGKADFGRCLTPALDIAVGKWLTPGIGLRVAYNGLRTKGVTLYANSLLVDGGQYPSGYYKGEWNVMNSHGDILLNLINMFRGYKEDRAYSFVPYVGAGFVHTGKGPGYDGLGINAGLINHFRLSSALDLNVELRGLLMKGAFGNSGPEGLAGLTVGVTYKFKKRGWDAVPTVPMVPESQLSDTRDRVNALKGENEFLKHDLVEARNERPEVIVKKEAGFVLRLVAVFNIGESSISKREYMSTEAMAKGAEATDKVFAIIEYADKGTGSTGYSIKLSKKRAEAIRDLMVNEFGVPASQLKVDYKDGAGNMFYDDAKLSRVAIVEE